MVDKESFSGPLTLEEIKWVLASEKPPEMIDRRATIGDANPSRTIYSGSPTKDYLIKKHFFGNSTDSLSDSFISEYLTPNETSQNDKNTSNSPTESVQNRINIELNNSLDNFNKVDVAQEGNSYTYLVPNRSFGNIDNDIENSLGQMSKVFNLTEAYTTFHASTEEGYVLNHENVPPFSQTEISKDIDGGQSLNQMDYVTVVSLEETKNSSKSLDISNNKNVSEVDVGGVQNLNNSSSVCAIASGVDESFKEQFLKETVIGEQLNQPNLYQSETFSEVVNLEVDKPLTSEALHAETTSVDGCNNSLTESNLVLKGSDTATKYRQTENVSSQSLQESFEEGFNDTLEEIEMALKYGLDYTMPNDTNNNFTTNVPRSDCYQQHELLTASTSKINNDTNSTQPPTNKRQLLGYKSKKTTIPVKSSQTTGTPQKSVSSAKLPLAKQHFNFKLPSTPAVIRKTPDFTSVFSPVAVYIKKSPKVPQIQRVSAKPVTGSPLFSKQRVACSSSKENENLPNRVYKPAKHTIVSKQKELRLPVSVQKHIPNTLNIIKHEARITKYQTSPMAVEKKLLNQDLTVCDSDASFSNASMPLQDISLQITKKV